MASLAAVAALTPIGSQLMRVHIESDVEGLVSVVLVGKGLVFVVLVVVVVGKGGSGFGRSHDVIFPSLKSFWQYSLEQLFKISLASGYVIVITGNVEKLFRVMLKIEGASIVVCLHVSGMPFFGGCTPCE